MSSNAIAKLGDSPILEQLSGNDKGQVFEMSGDRISIGRSENNDIVIVGDAVSRYHASIERQPDGGFIVRDQKSKNGVQVNGTSVEEAKLRDGDLVQVGTFMFRFRVPVGAETPEAIASAEQEGVYPSAVAGVSAGAKPKVNKRVLIYGILGVVLLAVFFMNGESEKKAPKPEDGVSSGTGGELKLTEPTPPPPIKGETQTPKVVGQEDPLLAGENDDERVKRGVEFRDAEQYFRKGLREFTNENYHRAVELFRTALTLNRNHELASYYLNLTYFEIEKLANKDFEIGRKYFQAMHYTRSIYHFNEVIQLLQHRPADRRIKDAERFIAQAKKKLQEAQQFP